MALRHPQHLLSLHPRGNFAPSFARTNVQLPRTAQNNLVPLPIAHPMVTPQQQAQAPMAQHQPEFVQGPSLQPSRPDAHHPVVVQGEQQMTSQAAQHAQGNYTQPSATNAQVSRSAPNHQAPPSIAYHSLAPQQQSWLPMSQPQPEFVQGSSSQASRPAPPQSAVQQPGVQPHMPGKVSKPRARRKQAAKGKENERQRQ